MNIKQEVVMQIQSNKHVSFSGLKINGCMNENNLRELKQFLSKRRNIKLISELEKDFKTDVVIYKEPSILNFEHKTYGGLGNYGLEPVGASNFSSNAAELKASLSKTIEKAKHIWDKILKQGHLH